MEGEKNRRRRERRPRGRKLSKINKEQLKKGIYIIPGIFTVANIYCGYYSIIQAIRENYEISAILIMIATFLDLIDGRIARLTKTTSRFGSELDSLADVVSFGVAPAILVYHWSLKNLPQIGWTFSFIYVICGAIRLARYNIASEPASRKYFTGLPIPPAAGILASFIFYSPEPIADRFTSLLVGLMVIFISFLMVSTVRYRTFKDIDWRQRQSWSYLVVMGVFFAAISYDPKFFLLLVGQIYLFSGGFFFAVNYLREMRKERGDREVVNRPENEEKSDEPSLP